MAKQPVLFIGGMGRSGSTLIERLLNEYRATFSVGETVHVWERGLRDNELCGCGDRFHDCVFWSEVGRTAFGSWTEIDVRQAIEQRWDIDRTRRLPQIVNAHRTGRVPTEMAEYLDLIGSVLVAAGTVARTTHEARIVVDSSKHLSSAALYALDDRLDLRVLHVIRDPRGVAFSSTKRVARPEAVEGGPMAEMPRYSPARTALRWVTDNCGFAQLERLGIPTLRLRYEDFLTDPLASLRTVAQFADIEPPDLPTDVFDGRSGELTTPMHSAAGNPMRFGSATVSVRLDDAWKSKMPAAQRRLVTALTTGTRQAFGYD